MGSVSLSENPIVVQDRGDEIWPDTWALLLDGRVLAYVQGEFWAGVLANIFNPHHDSLDLLDAMIALMRAGNQLAVDFERLRQDQ